MPLPAYWTNGVVREGDVVVTTAITPAWMKLLACQRQVEVKQVASSVAPANRQWASQLIANWPTLQSL